MPELHGSFLPEAQEGGLIGFTGLGFVGIIEKGMETTI